MARAYQHFSRDFVVKSAKAFNGHGSNNFCMLGFFFSIDLESNVIVKILFGMARGTSCSWIEGKCFVVLLCSSSHFSLSEDTNIGAGFGDLAQLRSWFIRLFHSLGFCLLNASLLLINAVDSSIKKQTNKQPSQVAAGTKSSGFCHSAWSQDQKMKKEDLLVLVHTNFSVHIYFIHF